VTRKLSGVFVRFRAPLNATTAPTVSNGNHNLFHQSNAVQPTTVLGGILLMVSPITVNIAVEHR
jgi:hypothetical protein